MKKYVLVCLALLSLILVGCKKEEEKVYYYVDYYDTRDNFLGEEKVEKGQDATMLVVEEVEGYYYFPEDENDLKNIMGDKIVTLTKKMYEKEVKYIIDGEVVTNTTVRYFEDVKEPTFDSRKMESFEWVEDKKIENNKYYITYTLSYVIKTNYSVKFYDGNELLNLGMDHFKSGVTTTLPTYTKEGYEFIGWFLDSISLAKYTEIPSTVENDLVFYARFTETVVHNRLVLPQANDHFTGVKKADNNVTQPVLPSTAKSTSAMSYTWSTSDKSIANISTFSSISIVSTGYVIITGTLISDPTYTVNGVFKTSANGVSLSSEEEANTITIVNITFKGKNGEVIETQKVKKGSYAYLPTPPTYEGYAFVGWDHENYDLQEDTIFTAQYEQGKTNRFVGKTISFLGDSLTSYLGYIPEGYASFFPYPTADVNDINMTYWMKTVNSLGAKLFVNNGWGGTCVQGGNDSTSSDVRLSTLKFGEQYSDVLIIFMGNNDCAANKNYPTSYNETTFETAYRTMLDKIKVLCPDQEVLLCTLPVSNLYTSESQDKYNLVIRSLASEYKMEIIELEEVDLTKPLDGKKLIVDSGHPSKLGMEVLYNSFIKELIK